MAETIYSLCILTSMACAWLLLASYRRTRYVCHAASLEIIPPPARPPDRVSALRSSDR